MGKREQVHEPEYRNHSKGLTWPYDDAIDTRDVNPLPAGQSLVKSGKGDTPTEAFDWENWK